MEALEAACRELQLMGKVLRNAVMLLFLASLHGDVFVA